MAVPRPVLRYLTTGLARFFSCQYSKNVKDVASAMGQAASDKPIKFIVNTGEQKTRSVSDRRFYCERCDSCQCPARGSLQEVDGVATYPR